MQMEAGLDTGPMLLDARDADRRARNRRDACTIASQRSVRKRCSMRSTGSRRARQRRVRSRGRRDVRGEDPQGRSAIDWSRSAAEIDRQIRAFNPWPVAETRWNGQQLRVWEAHAASIRRRRRDPGKVLGTSAAGIDVGTGDGVLALTRVQSAGRKAMSAAEFLKAHRLDGAVLGS